MSAFRHRGKSLAMGAILGIAACATPVAGGESTFVRSDCNLDGAINIADAIAVLSYLFYGGAVTCLDACDVSDDGEVDIGDAIAHIAFLFSAGPAPASPYPECGVDPTRDGLNCGSTGGLCPPTSAPPEITSTAPASAMEGTPFVYDVEATDPNPGNVLAFTLVESPIGSSIDSASGLLEWTPGFDQAGDSAFTVRVTDLDDLFDEQSFVVAVENVNRPPSITTLPPSAAVPGQRLTYPAAAEDPDAESTLTWSLVQSPTGAEVDDTTGTVTWTPETTDSGLSFEFELRVTDDGGLSDEQSFTVMVAPSLTPLYRINCGGPDYTDSQGQLWVADFGFDTGGTLSTPQPIANTNDPDLYQTERFDLTGPPDLTYALSLSEPQSVLLRLHFAEIWASGISGPGQRQFDVAVEGIPALDNYDPWGMSGAILTAQTVEISTFVDDGELTITFTGVVQNAKVNAIEVLRINSAIAALGALPAAINLGTAGTGSESNPRTVTLAPVSNASITVTSVTVSDGFSAEADGLPLTLAPGESLDTLVRFAPTDPGFQNGTMTIEHSGINSPTEVRLLGNAFDGTATIGFIPGALPGESSVNPTTLQFGPDGRLYVGQQNGVIKVYDIVRNGPADYTITSTETINLIRDIPNHNDDGTPNPFVPTRQVVGLLLTGTAETPVMFVSSSDPRIELANPDPPPLSLDTNSGVVSRLTWNGSAWEKLDLVRGLPRSEENHGSNGLQLDPTTNTLYLAQGGNTNLGAPSTNLSYLAEYALSGAVLSIDLDAIGETTYDLPTLDDEDRPGVADFNDPFGGNDGKNQAILVPGGPVQVYAPGFRNPYDVVLTTQGRLYTIDNGGNGGWGDIPLDCTNDFRDGGIGEPDSLHYLAEAGYYGGHPNPTRADMMNTFNPTQPQSPVSVENPEECITLFPGVEDLSLTTLDSSTNGICEFTASNFGGALQGDLLAASFDGSIYRMVLDPEGASLAQPVEAVFSEFGLEPLDVTAQGDDDVFPGTVWVAVYGSGTIALFEPTDFGGTISTCTGADDPALDEDGDGYTNADEIASGTNPCSPASVPPDLDGDFVSDLLDTDDDNDGIDDFSDAFARDPSNGTMTPLPLFYSWDNGDPNPGGILGLGFTGLMSNGQDYADLYDPSVVIASGAAGVVTVAEVGPGTSEGGTNTQEFGLQFGIPVTVGSAPVRVGTRVLAPFATVSLVDNESFGLYVGTGSQDDYVKVVVNSLAGAGGVEVGEEVAGTYTSTTDLLPILSATVVDLFLIVDPATGTVQPQVSIDLGPIIDLGLPRSVPASWFAADALAVGILSTSDGAPTYAATWDFIEVVQLPTSGSPSAAQVTVDTASGIDSGSETPGAFQVTNDSPTARITRVRVDLSASVLPDLVFDPIGVAGDVDGLCLTVDSDPTSVGWITAFDPCTSPFSQESDGGFQVLNLYFDDFDPGETFSFSLDVDPSSIQGTVAPGSGLAGLVSGLELTGAKITVEFDDAAIHVAHLFASPGSVQASRARVQDVAGAAPTVEVVGLSSPATVTTDAQTIRVTGPAGADVRVLISEGALWLADVPGGGFDVEPFEANSVVAVTELTATLDAGGEALLPFALIQTAPEAGIYRIVAVMETAGDSGEPSNVFVVEYAP